MKKTKNIIVGKFTSKVDKTDLSGFRFKFNKKLFELLDKAKKGNSLKVQVGKQWGQETFLEPVTVSTLANKFSMVQLYIDLAIEQNKTINISLIA